MTISDTEFVDYSLCKPSPLNDEDSIEPLPNTFEPRSSWFTGHGAELVGSTSNNDSSNVLEPERLRSTTLPSLDNSTVWVDDLIGSSAPLVIPDVPKPFDGQIPVKGTISAAVKRSLQQTGKVPNVNIFVPEDECVLLLTVAFQTYMNISL
jgi:hypothetical protein